MKLCSEADAHDRRRGHSPRVLTARATAHFSTMFRRRGYVTWKRRQDDDWRKPWRKKVAKTG